MSSNVNVWLTNWKVNDSTPGKFSCVLDVTLQWHDDAGRASDARSTLKWPDILALVPAELIREELTALMLKVFRVQQGIDKTTEAVA